MRLVRSKSKLAGAGGLEPTNAGSKDRCLTTWLRPNANFKKLIGNNPDAG